VSAPSSPEALRGLALIALAAVSWGTTGAVTTVLVARAGATPLVIGAVRMLVAAVLLMAAARALAAERGAARGERWRCVAAGVFNAGFQAAYFTAVTRSGIAVAVHYAHQLGILARFHNLDLPGTSIYFRVTAPYTLISESLDRFPLGYPLGQTDFIASRDYYINWENGSQTNIDKMVPVRWYCR